MDGDTLIEVFVVNRETNNSVSDNHTIQFGCHGHGGGKEKRIAIRDAIAGVVKVNGPMDNPDYEFFAWGLNHEKFPSLSSAVKLMNSNAIALGDPRTLYWYGATLTLDEVIAMIKADLP